MPIEPSGLSTWASDLTVHQVQEAQELKNIKCGFVVSRKTGNTVIGREIRSMATAMGIPILANEIAQRVAYAESLTMGKMIFEWAPESPAACEIEKLTKEILSYEQRNHSRAFRHQKKLPPMTPWSPLKKRVQATARPFTAIAAGHRAVDLESPVNEGVRRTVQAIERNHRRRARPESDRPPPAEAGPRDRVGRIGRRPPRCRPSYAG